jgi:hypothetical protein
MIELRRAETNADLEAWIRVRRTILPHESGGTVERLREQAKKPECLFLIAEMDGDLAGSGFAERSDLGEHCRQAAGAPGGAPAWCAVTGAAAASAWR